MICIFYCNEHNKLWLSVPASHKHPSNWSSLRHGRRLADCGSQKLFATLPSNLPFPRVHAGGLHPANIATSPTKVPLSFTIGWNPTTLTAMTTGELVQLYIYDLSGGLARAFSPMLLGKQVNPVIMFDSNSYWLDMRVCERRSVLKSRFEYCRSTACGTPPWLLGAWSTTTAMASTLPCPGPLPAARPCKRLIWGGLRG